jgi:NAD(P)-dependent dehydrogenase (short-subunit alcohol dehydrogenase family)
MRNKTIIVTGATSGIGIVTARELARQEATVILAARNETKAKKNVATIREATNHDRVHYLLVDFSSQASIRQMAAEFLNQFNRLDILINNHGTVNILREETVDGLEETFAVNHLGYFLLTNLLLDRLKEGATPEDPGRIINVSSSAHWGSKIEFDNLQLKRGYSWSKAYGRSKLANILFTVELARRLEGSHVTANALHPGWVATSIGADAIPIPFLGRIGKFFINLTATSPEQGAQTSIYLASSPEVIKTTGEYFIQSKPARCSAAAKEQEVAHRLWQVSEQMVGLA